MGPISNITDQTFLTDQVILDRNPETTCCDSIVINTNPKTKQKKKHKPLGGIQLFFFFEVASLEIEKH